MAYAYLWNITDHIESEDAHCLELQQEYTLANTSVSTTSTTHIYMNSESWTRRSERVPPIRPVARLMHTYAYNISSSCVFCSPVPRNTAAIITQHEVTSVEVVELRRGAGLASCVPICVTRHRDGASRLNLRSCQHLRHRERRTEEAADTGIRRRVCSDSKRWGQRRRCVTRAADTTAFKSGRVERKI